MAVDWESACQPIQNQGGCGSCTAFGSTGAVEANFKILHNMSIKLSETDTFFCSGGKCSEGNYVEPVLDRLIRGVSTQSCSPYYGFDVACGFGRCSNWWTTGYKIASWKSITKTDEMKKALDKAPLVGVMAVHQSFMNYVSGVYHNLGNSDPILGGHCIAIVGYNDDLGAWKIRNSWGTGWGEKGYCWIKYGDSGIDSEMWEVVPSLDKPDPDPPTPSPCKLGNGVAKALSYVAKTLGRKGRFYYLNP